MPGESNSTPRKIRNYLGRISGPLLDRIDLHIEVPAREREVPGDQRRAHRKASAQFREQVITA